MRFLGLAILAFIPFVLTQAVQIIQRRQPTTPTHKLTIRESQTQEPKISGGKCVITGAPWEASPVTEVTLPDGSKYKLKQETTAGCCYL